jgi:hypothetical protein
MKPTVSLLLLCSVLPACADRPGVQVGRLAIGQSIPAAKARLQIIFEPHQDHGDVHLALDGETAMIDGDPFLLSPTTGLVIDSGVRRVEAIAANGSVLGSYTAAALPDGGLRTIIFYGDLTALNSVGFEGVPVPATAGDTHLRFMNLALDEKPLDFYVTKGGSPTLVATNVAYGEIKEVDAAPDVDGWTSAPTGGAPASPFSLACLTEKASFQGWYAISPSEADCDLAAYLDSLF